MAERLKRGGRAIIQTITIRDEFFAGYRTRSDFVRHYVFPGGMLPSLTRFREEAEKAGLKFAGAFGFGKDYARTLREWLVRMQAAEPQIKALGHDQQFLRKLGILPGDLRRDLRSGAHRCGAGGTGQRLNRLMNTAAIIPLALYTKLGIGRAHKRHQQGVRRSIATAYGRTAQFKKGFFHVCARFLSRWRCWPGPPLLANAAGDAKAGEAVFKRCAVCHTSDKGGGDAPGPQSVRRCGPQGGHPSPGFAYSAPLQKSGITWTEANLTKWTAGPARMVPGTKMAFAGISSKKQQADVDGLSGQPEVGVPPLRRDAAGS